MSSLNDGRGGHPRGVETPALPTHQAYDDNLLSMYTIMEDWFFLLPSSDSFIKRFLRKQRWPRCFFVLHKQPRKMPSSLDDPVYKLSYFKDKTKTRQLGCIDLSGCEEIQSKLVNNNFSNVLCISIVKRRHRRKRFYLAADCEPVMNSWVKKICELCGFEEDDPPPIQQINPLGDMASSVYDSDYGTRGRAPQQPPLLHLTQHPPHHLPQQFRQTPHRGSVPGPGPRVGGPPPHRGVSLSNHHQSPAEKYDYVDHSWYQMSVNGEVSRNPPELYDYVHRPVSAAGTLPCRGSPRVYYEAERTNGNSRSISNDGLDEHTYYGHISHNSASQDNGDDCYYGATEPLPTSLTASFSRPLGDRLKIPVRDGASSGSSNDSDDEDETDQSNSNYDYVSHDSAENSYVNGDENLQRVPSLNYIEPQLTPSSPTSSPSIMRQVAARVDSSAYDDIDHDRTAAVKTAVAETNKLRRERDHYQSTSSHRQSGSSPRPPQPASRSPRGVVAAPRSSTSWRQRTDS